MNIFKKFYCRAYQIALRIALPILPYREPVLLKDYDELVTTLKNLGKTSVLLVTDKSIRNLGLTADLENIISQNEISLFVYDNTVANPTIKNVEEAKELGIKIQ